MFFDTATPDTSGYMIAGYVVFFVVTAIYITSLIIRTTNLKRDLQTLEALEAEQRAAPAISAPANSRTTRGKRAQPTGRASKPVRRKSTTRR